MIKIEEVSGDCAHCDSILNPEEPSFSVSIRKPYISDILCKDCLTKLGKEIQEVLNG